MKPRYRADHIGSFGARRGCRAFYDALVNALANSGTARTESANRPPVTMDECETLLNKYPLELIAAQLVACNGGLAWSIKTAGA